MTEAWLIGATGLARADGKKYAEMYLGVNGRFEGTARKRFWDWTGSAGNAFKFSDQSDAEFFLECQREAAPQLFAKATSVYVTRGNDEDSPAPQQQGAAAGAVRKDRPTGLPDG